MKSISLSAWGNAHTDLKHTEADGWWIEHSQPTFSCVSKAYESEAAARAAFDADEVEWLND
jgi:hypothetical protein